MASMWLSEYTRRGIPAWRVMSAYANWYALLKSSWHSALVSVAAQTCIVLAVVLAGRGLGPTSYGQIAAISAFYGWFTLLAGYATHIRLPRIMADPQERNEMKHAACATSFWLAVCLILLGSAAALALLPIGLHRLGCPELYPVALLYVVVFALAQLRVSLDAISQSAGWLRQWSVSNLVGTLLPVVFIAAFFCSHAHLTPWRYMVLLALATTVGTAVSLVIFFAKLGGWRQCRLRRALLRPFLSAGAGPWLALLSNVLLLFGVQTIIAAHCSSRALGYYSTITALSTWVVNILGVSLSIPALSEWSQLATSGRLPELRHDFRRRQLATIVVLGSIAIFPLMWPEKIIQCLYGTQYLPSAPLLRIICLNWIISGAGCWYMSCMYALGHPWRVAIPNLAVALPTVVLTDIVVTQTRFGLAGVVAVGVITMLAWLGTYEWNFRQAMNSECRAVIAHAPVREC